jgi:hemin uptake protein HemP
MTHHASSLAFQADAPPNQAVPPEHDALDLTQGGPLARIALNGQIYTLRITRQGKLILTK